jgi:hypothetical protein
MASCEFWRTERAKVSDRHVGPSRPDGEKQAQFEVAAAVDD